MRFCQYISHFSQGYPNELLPVTVTGIPSMHICVDFIAELISQPSFDKQEFAINLISHLALQYALPHSMMVARLSLNTFSTLLSGKLVHFTFAKFVLHLNDSV